MKSYFLLIGAIIISTLSYGQNVDILVQLSDPLRESSGLIYLDDKLITINDSGGDAALYEVDILTGEVNRTVVITNASNVDWEEIFTDDQFIYICDFGNNNGSRTDLKIYRASISDYLNVQNTSISVDTVVFSYADQIDFTPSNYSTNFDAEAAFALDDSIYIFTKNWGDNNTNVYSLPKTPGNYQAHKIETLDAQGLITGASYDANSGSIVLTGYAIPLFFIIEIPNASFGSGNSNQIERIQLPIPSGFSTQVEGIARIDDSHYFITSEKSLLGSSGLFLLSLDDFAGLTLLDRKTIEIYPNPASSIISISGVLAKSKLMIYSMNGQMVHSNEYTALNGSNGITIPVNNLDSGMYLVEIQQGEMRYQGRFIKQ